MAKIELDGFDTYLAQLEGLRTDSLPMCKAIVFPGAKVLADAMRAEVNGLPAMSDGAAKAHWQAGVPMPMISESQKLSRSDLTDWWPVKMYLYHFPEKPRKEPSEPKKLMDMPLGTNP